MKHSRRLGELALGHTVNWLTVQGFDYLLYPFVIWKLGPLVGGGIMALASLVICLLTLWFYDWSKRDWLGIEVIVAGHPKCTTSGHFKVHHFLGVKSGSD